MDLNTWDEREEGIRDDLFFFFFCLSNLVDVGFIY